VVLCHHWRQPRRGCRGHIPPQYVGWGDVNGNIPPILLRTFGYSRPILVALHSLSLKPISFGYKTPPIRFSQAGGQSAHKARPPQPWTRVDATVCHCACFCPQLQQIISAVWTSQSRLNKCQKKHLFHSSDGLTQNVDGAPPVCIARVCDTESREVIGWSFCNDLCCFLLNQARDSVVLWH